VPPGNEVLINFTARYQQVVQATNAIIKQFKLISAELLKIGEGAQSDSFAKRAKEMSTAARATMRDIQLLTNNLELLERVQAKFKPGAKTIGRERLSPAEGFLVDPEGTQKRITAGDVDKQAKETLAELIRQRTKLNTLSTEGEQEIARFMVQHAEQAQKIISLATQEQFIKQRTARLLSGDVEGQILERRAQLLREAAQAAQQNQVALEQALTRQTGRAGDRINKVREQEEKKLNAALSERERILSRLKSLESDMAKGAALSTRERKAQQDLQKKLLDDLGRADRKAATARGNLEEPEARLGVLAGLSSGAEEALKRNAQFLQRIREQQIKLNNEGLKGFASGLDDTIKKLARINAQLQVEPEGTKKRIRLQREFNETLLEAERLEGLDPAALGIEGFESLSDVAARELAALPRLERLFIGAFDDMGRRFQATLQFAISGALIFGVQQLARRFIETAIEVERAFADIGTAFEFDIDAERGTTEFRQQLNEIRIEVLQLADEFNVLPTEANKAAFSMVSRFGDASDALKALRAQLLATKISTIDQAEALRALSSVAENFAAASLFVADGASIGEKLMQREATAVLNYGKALDVATLLQQRFGVEVEDTLEGVSRLAPTFAKMGFSMEQTAAIVASISRELGLTGSSVADSVNRSLGQLVEPGIRDQLLDLAAASSNLTLTFQDFETGEKALSALVEQFRNLEQVDPQTAFKVLNVIGQRRELDVVAALFNTTDLQEAMVGALTGAAGAAEQRFTVLSRTISERLSSIGTGFERLAQNFTQLGLLTPLQLAVAAFDELLQGANSFLETLTKIIAEAGIIGDVLKGALTFTIARSSLTRLAGLIASVSTFGLGKVAAIAGGKEGALAASVSTGATKLGTIFKELASSAKGHRIGLVAMTGALFQATGALIKMTFSALSASVGNTLNTGLNKLAFAFNGRLMPAALALEAGIARTGLSMGAFGVAASAGALAVGLLAGAAINFQNAVDAAAKASKGFTNAQLSATAQARRERLEDPRALATPESFNRRVAELTLIALQQQNAELDSFFERLTLGIVAATAAANQGQQDLADLVAKNQGGELSDQQRAELLGDRTGQREDLAGDIIKQLVPGTPEFQAALEREQTRAVLAATVAELIGQAIAAGARASITGTGLTSPGSNGLPGLIDLDPFAGGLDATKPNDQAAVFLRNANLLVREIQLATDDISVANAQSALDVLVADWEEYMSTLEGSVQNLEGTVNSASNEISRAQREFSVGRIGNAEFVERLREIERDLRARAAAQFGKDEEAAQEAITLAEQILLQIVQHEISVLDVDRAAAQQLPSEVARLRAELDILQRELLQIEKTNFNDIALKQIEITKTVRAIADATRAAATAVAQIHVGGARTSAEWFKAQEALIDALLAELENIIAEGGSYEEFHAARQAWEDAKDAVTDRLLDEAQRTAIATARLRGPINDKMNQLAGQIKAVRLALAAEDDPLEALELQVQLRELLAQVLQEEIARMSAFVEAQAGATNEILSLKGQITVAIAEIEAAASIFGTLSSEFNRAKAALANLKNQLAQALLSLDDMNRRLGSDLSNDFEQAILDLQLLAEKLQAPDLGDLEKAQLLLEQARGEMAAERSFFSTELFNLRFLSETGAIGTGAYLSALRSLLGQVDTTTQQGKEIFLEIQSLIDGLTDDIGELAFNVPTAIRLPTLFEVRRALAADQLGVTYQDNRQMDITIDVRDATDVEALVEALASSLGGSVTSTAGRYAPGASSLTLGGF
jgi:hypothetical protein